MKRIFVTLTVLIFATVFSVTAQQSSGKAQGATAGNAVNPNIERTRIVNEKIAGERLASRNRTTTKVVPAQKNKATVERTKAANRATLPATAPVSGK